jgi:hypothetical protein
MKSRYAKGEKMKFEFKYYRHCLLAFAFVSMAAQVCFAQLVIPLTEGENLISINIIPPPEFFREGEARGPDVVLMFEQIQDQILIVEDQNGDFCVPIWDYSNIAFWDLTQAYMVTASEDVDFVIDGDPIPFDADIQLREGVNWIAYFPDFELDASAPDFYVLSPIIDVVVRAADGQGNIMIPEDNFSNMEPWHEGMGYIVEVTEDVILNYPNIPELRWLALPDSGFVEDGSLQLRLEYLYDHIRSPDFPDSVLVISVEDGEHVFGELDEEGLTITADQDWNGLDSLMLIVTDPDENSDSTYQLIMVVPVNDPPCEFDLLTPENNYYPGGDEVVYFSWEESTDPDGDADVHYLLIMVLEWFEDVMESQSWDCNTRNFISLPDSGSTVPWPFYGDWVPQCYWWIEAISGDDTTNSNSRFYIDLPVSVCQIEGVVCEFRLYTPSPNPFNSSTTITYGLGKPALTRLALYDLSGRQVSMLFEGYQRPGFHTTTLDAGDLAAGLYFVRLEAAENLATRKIVLAK